MHRRELLASVELADSGYLILGGLTMSVTTTRVFICNEIYCIRSSIS